MISNTERLERGDGLLSVAYFCLVLSFTLATAGAQQYTISTFAGGGTPLATPSPGLDLWIGAVSNIATDSAGNVYFPTAGHIFKLNRDGIVTSIAGPSQAPYSGDGGPATNAQLSGPQGIAVDAGGNLFFVDGNRVRRIAPSGIISTVAGNVTLGYSGDGGPAVDAQFSFPGALAVDASGNLFVSDNDRVRKVSATGIVTTVAGNGTRGFSGDGQPAINSELSGPAGLAVDGAGNLYIADFSNFRVRRVSSDGVITTVAGTGEYGFSGDGGRAIDAKLFSPLAVALDGAGNLYIADCDCGFGDDSSGVARIRKVSPGGIITTVAGSGGCCFAGDGGPATSAQLYGAGAIAVDAAGNLFIADTDNFRLRKVSQDGTINTIVGKSQPPQPCSDGCPAATNRLVSRPMGVVVDAAGDLIIADFATQKVSPDGVIHTIANVGGPAITEDAQGNLYTGGLAINKISTSGAVTRVAGVGGFGTPGVGGYGLAVNGAGDLFVGSGFVISKISSSGAVTTVAGNGGCCFVGDGGPATSAQLNDVTGLLLDRAGNLLLSETYGNRVRKISPDGTITTIVGTGVAGFSGDGGQAARAQLNGPDGLALDDAGNLYIADVYNQRVRMVTPDGIITTIAGTGSAGLSGDGGPAANAQLNYPWSVAVDQQGNVYVADNYNYVVRKLRPAYSSVLVLSVVDIASGLAEPVSPGKIVRIQGAGVGPAELVQNQASNGQFGTELGGTRVFFNGIAASILSASASQVVAIVPYTIGGMTAEVAVASQGHTSETFTVPVAPSAPGIFTLNQAGTGQIAAINVADGTINSAANPVKAGAYITLYATGEGQTQPAGLDGKVSLAGLPKPLLPVTVTVAGMPAFVEYAGGAPGQTAGLMQINVQIPTEVHSGGYIPVVLKVGDASTNPEANWIAVSGN